MNWHVADQGIFGAVSCYVKIHVCEKSEYKVIFITHNLIFISHNVLQCSTLQNTFHPCAINFLVDIGRRMLFKCIRQLALGRKFGLLVKLQRIRQQPKRCGWPQKLPPAPPHRTPPFADIMHGHFHYADSSAWAFLCSNSSTAGVVETP